jgi:hypothetical protein
VQDERNCTNNRLSKTQYPPRRDLMLKEMESLIEETLQEMKKESKVQHMEEEQARKHVTDLAPLLHFR